MNLPNQWNIVLCDILFSAMEYLHIILEILKRRIKIIRHQKFSLCTAESTPFTAFLNNFGCKGKNNRSLRYLAGYFNCQPVAGWYFYGLCNAHKENIA